MTLFKFTVYRDNWYRGKGPYGSLLSGLYSDKEGKACRMGCCLGHAMSDLGLALEDFDTFGEVGEITLDKDDNNRSENKVFATFLKAEGDAIISNDSEHISDLEREQRLKDIFASHDIEVEFKDGKREWNTKSTFEI